MSKRPGFSVSSQISSTNKKSKPNGNNPAVTVTHNRNNPNNKFLARPVPSPEESIKHFLIQARTSARANVPKETPFPITKPFAEIEARIGITKTTSMRGDTRVLSSGPKRIWNKKAGRMMTVHAFNCTVMEGDPNANRMKCNFEGGITRAHFTHWTMAGLSEASPISSAFGVRTKAGSSSESALLKEKLHEIEMVETVYGGYPNHDRICFPGDHNPQSQDPQQKKGVMEHKSKLATLDLALPSAPYDMRITLATERTLAANVTNPPAGWTSRRLKRRRSYKRKDDSCNWQLDVTEITCSKNPASSSSSEDSNPETLYEIEVELDATVTLNLINETNPSKIDTLCNSLSRQLWWILSQINPSSDVGDVEDLLREHPNTNAVKLAQAQCGAIRRFMDARKHGNNSTFTSAIAATGKSPTPSPQLCNDKFPGCMPVNFGRENIEEVQRSSSNGYYLSEKTDGVRYFMVFTGDTVVLIDRRMKGKQPIPKPGNVEGEDPMSPVLSLIEPGTVLDGEVVMNRKYQQPIFIVFDVLCTSANSPVLHLPFQERLKHLERESFRKGSATQKGVNVFSNRNAAPIADAKIALPLVMKNFVQRTDLDTLLSHVVEEKGMRSYKNGDVHHHLTDGIIFQPNSPYVCSTDHNLLKWKYLDTVTIDVKIIDQDPSNGFYNGGGNNNDNDDDVLNVYVSGEEGSMVNMTRFIRLPQSERRRLEADRMETNADVAEVGFDPTTGEWYYLTMRPDKEIPNHISTVLGTLLELAESLDTEELRYRMSVPVGMRDVYRKSMRKMQKQLLDCQRSDIQKMKQHQRRK